LSKLSVEPLCNFPCPIGAAFFAIEVCYGSLDFNPGVILYSVLVSDVVDTRGRLL
jgi:H+/Cl- antiporter ClcA